MYSVSNDFLAAVRQPVQEHRITGTIGIVSFGDANIVGGSFHIQNQCTDTSDVVLGSVYTGVLTAVFHGINISRYSWVGMMMLPKTICYMYIGVLGYLDVRKRKENHEK